MLTAYYNDWNAIATVGKKMMHECHCAGVGWENKQKTLGKEMRVVEGLQPHSGVSQRRMKNSPTRKTTVEGHTALRESARTFAVLTLSRVINESEFVGLQMDLRTGFQPLGNEKCWQDQCCAVGISLPFSVGVDSDAASIPCLLGGYWNSGHQAHWSFISTKPRLCANSKLVLTQLLSVNYEAIWYSKLNYPTITSPFPSDPPIPNLHPIHSWLFIYIYSDLIKLKFASKWMELGKNHPTLVWTWWKGSQPWEWNWTQSYIPNTLLFISH